MSSYESLCGRKLNLSRLKVFGNTEYVHTLGKVYWTKINIKLERCVFVNYFLEHKVCKCYNPSTKKVAVQYYVQQIGIIVHPNLMSTTSLVMFVDDNDIRLGQTPHDHVSVFHHDKLPKSIL